MLSNLTGKFMSDELIKAFRELCSGRTRPSYIIVSRDANLAQQANSLEKQYFFIQALKRLGQDVEGPTGPSTSSFLESALGDLRVTYTESGISDPHAQLKTFEQKVKQALDKTFGAEISY